MIPTFRGILEDVLGIDVCPTWAGRRSLLGAGPHFRCGARLGLALIITTRPVLVDCFLEGPAKDQNDQNERSAQHNDLPFGNRASCPDTCSNPDAGCCSQAMDVMTSGAADNYACPQKPNPGHDALYDTARVGAG